MALTRKQKRLGIIFGIGAVLALSLTLILSALQDQIVFFYSPAELATHNVGVGQPLRIGGLVKQGSWVKDGETNTFVVSDGKADATVTYVGILPDLFREGQGVIAEGSLTSKGTFKATTVLAKHDERYIPKEVAEKLKALGEWRPEAGGN